jgi:hypothetical protein
MVIRLDDWLIKKYYLIHILLEKYVKL